VRTLRKTVVLGLAALGLYKAWELIKARTSAAQERVGEGGGKVLPVLREATRSIRSASREAAETVRDVSLTAAETAESVANAIGDAEADGAQQSEAHSV
jgi:hypothetical protein